MASTIDNRPQQEAFKNLLHQEICMQRNNEQRWRNLVATMAPDCAGFENVFNQLDSVLVEALARIIAPNAECPPIDVLVPLSVDVSLGPTQLQLR